MSDPQDPADPQVPAKANGDTTPPPSSDLSIPITANGLFVEQPLALDKLQAILTSIESTDDVNAVDPLYPTNSWVEHVYSATNPDTKKDGYFIVYGLPQTPGGLVQAKAVTGADDAHMALNASIEIGRGNELIGYEDFAGPTRVVIFRDTNASVAPVGAPSSLSWDTSNHPERREWSWRLVTLVSQNRASLDLANPNDFIPGFKLLSDSMQTKFWAEMLVAIAQFESSWEPEEVYHEKKGGNSVGLLQLSFADGKSYKLTPPIGSEEGLKNAVLNLTWGVAIFSSLLGKDKIVASGSTFPNVKGAARYWSTMRAGHKVELIKALTRKNVGL